MDWTYPTGAGPEGLFEMGRRLAEHLGRLPDATSFLSDPREMLRVTRRVESVARGGRLWVGFQTAAKLDAEAARYRSLVEAGTRVIAFGSDRPGMDLTGIEYRQQRPDRYRLTNQWFLVSDEPERVAFVSWEISDELIFGKGGAATSGKQFVGFISDDPLVVGEVVRVISGTPGIPPAPGASPRMALTPARDERTAELLASLESVVTTKTGAPDGAVVVPLRRDDDGNALRLAIAIARDEKRPLVVVDRSGESILGSPYHDLRGDDDYRPRPDRLFDAFVARREGRSITASAIAAATSLGVPAGGWFPTASGADGLREALRRFGGSILVVPGSLRAPSIAERIRGMSLEALERLGVPLVVAD
jgi:hypothetical protein